MWLLAVIQWSSIIPLVIGIFGVAGLIFTALKYNRDDTTAIVSQQSTVLNDMRALNDELRQTAVSLRGERDALQAQVAHLTGQVEALHVELQSGVTRIERKLDNPSSP